MSKDEYEGKALSSEAEGPHIIRHLAKLKRVPGMLDALERTLEVDKGLDVPLVSALLLAVDQVSQSPSSAAPATLYHLSQHVLLRHFLRLCIPALLLTCRRLFMLPL